MDDIKAAEGHLRDLAERSYNKGIYTFSGFLGEASKSVLVRMKKELSYAGVDTFGGREYADRVVARFGNEEILGYVQEYPITCLKVAPVSLKFSETLTHRDFLGALMNLGIERELLGDIIVRENEAFIFCLDHIASFICENLTRVRHTVVSVSETAELPENAEVKFRETGIIAASARLDAIVSKVFNLSRSSASSLFSSGKIFVNGAECKNESTSPKENDIISVRGYGKFIYTGQEGTTGKGRLRITVKLFV